MKSTENIYPENPDIKTPLTDIDLDYFRNLLEKNRKDARVELDALQENLDNIMASDDEEYSALTHHEADVGSDVEEEETNFKLIERTRKYIEQINDALERIENKTYGVCMATGKQISKGRLEAVPHTRYSIQAKKKGLVRDD